MSVKMVRFKHVDGHGVPGGHRVLWDGKAREPFVPPTREFRSIALRHSDIVVDIGAYCGTYAIMCARFPVQRVVAYEPTPATWAVLSLTKLPNLKPVRAAVVGGDEQEVSLFVSRGIGVTNSIVKAKAKAGKMTVPAVRYEDAVRGASIVKIDVEGAEYDYDFVQPSLRAIIVDFHPLEGKDWVSMAREKIRAVEQAGFRPVISPDFSNGWTCAGSWERPMETNGQCDALMEGRACCGCGIAITAQSRALCSSCWKAWKPKDREDYQKSSS